MANHIKCYQEGKSCKNEKGSSVLGYQYAVEDPKKAHKRPARVSERML